MTQEFGILEMEITDFMANLMRENFDIEIEMMQGKIEKLPDGRTRYILKLNEEKGELIKRFILAAMFKDNKINPN